MLLSDCMMPFITPACSGQVIVPKNCEFDCITEASAPVPVMTANMVEFDCRMPPAKFVGVGDGFEVE